eukprot:TRINITY_DN5258_c0_g1_i5.p1 TRINITY_DN5258_c0_g1~~TRINITY_DN5258_c0_g1_i5.p1  ORF type:complete len:438 (+),score=37.24 TRINITY_DN5258_c0_g1_i5:24-1316(+)
MTHLLEIPNEVVSLVLGFMSPKYLYVLSMCNKVLYTLQDNEELWSHSFQSLFPKSHYALVVVPSYVNWSFRHPSSRLILYLMALKRETDLEKQEIDIIMDVMSENRHSSLVQKAAAYLVRRLSYRPPGCTPNYSSEVFTNKRTFGDRKALDILIYNLIKFKNPEMADGILCALTNLAVDAHNCSLMVEQGYIQIILDCMTSYQQNYHVLEKAFSCLANVCREDDKCKQIVKQSGKIDLMLQLLDSTGPNPEEKRHALNLLVVLSKRDPLLRENIGELVIRSVASLFSQFSENDKIFSYLCEALQRFCKHIPKNQALAQELQLHTKLLKILRESKVVESFYDILFALFHMMPKQHLPLEDGCNFLNLTIQKMKEYPDSPNFQMGASYVLTDFAQGTSHLLDYNKNSMANTLQFLSRYLSFVIILHHIISDL